MIHRLEMAWKFPFCIYGAGIVATSVYTAIKILYRKKPLFFLVSDSESKAGMPDDAPTEIDGIAVKRLSAWKRKLQESQLLQSADQDMIIPEYYLIAVPEIHHQTIIKNLRSLNLSNLSITDSQIIPITNKIENELMEAYYASRSDCITLIELLQEAKRPIPQISRRRKDISIQIFQARSHMDKLFHTKQSLSAAQDGRLPCYMVPIQAGTVLTTESVASLKDNAGKNISAKNRNYCELTATYYAWKNSRAAYKGICHYRRIFDIDDTRMQAMLALEDKWDAILPYPSVYYPNIAKEHTRYVNESDWEAMLSALQETAPEYFAAYEKSIADGEQFFDNFNMLIARAEVFDDYCNFLFTVLERTEELTTPKGWERADRFAGYLGENLTTIYFLKNREKLKITYAGKVWLT